MYFGSFKGIFDNYKSYIYRNRAALKVIMGKKLEKTPILLNSFIGPNRIVWRDIYRGSGGK